MGEGCLPVFKDLGNTRVELDPNLMVSDLDELCNFVFSSISINYLDFEWLTSRAIICPTNEEVARINDMMMKKVPGQEKVYLSSDYITDKEQEHIFGTEFLHTVSASGLPPHELRLKVNTPIMLMRNLDPHNGHCNGTRYVITELRDNVIEAKIATGSRAGQLLFIPRIPISPPDDILPCHMVRRQFPVKVAFAITSHKSQGQTLKKVGIYMKKNFFSHGQLYVAMSRVGNPANLKIFSETSKEDKYRDKFFTDNVVFHEVLS